jgi:putative ABC transport system permease protein
MGGRRFNVLLLTSFAALALLLAAVGIYGVMSYVVAQRTHEIGVRLALGASRANILALVLTRSARLMLIGVTIGVAGAFASAKLLATLTFGIKTYDLTVIAFSSLLLYIVGMLATYLPAQGASKVDPIIALRYE